MALALSKMKRAGEVMTKKIHLNRKDLATDQSVTQELEADMTLEELEELAENSSSRDPHFRSELEYDGYQNIQSYDNDAFESTLGSETDSTGELNFNDRAEDSSITEESIIDKQDHRNDHA